MAAPTDIRQVSVIAPNLKWRLSGVTSSIIQLVPVQNALGQRVAVLGPGLPKHLPHLRLRDLLHFWQRPADGGERIWHARRNIEMLAGILMRDILRMPLKLVFTSAAQRRHSAYTRFLMQRMDAIVATSKASASYLDLPSRVVPHGIDLQRFAREETSPQALPYLIGCFGRIRPQKGTDLFVRSMIALLPHYPDWTAVICGRAVGRHKAFAEALQQAARDAGLSDRILFLGEVEDIRPWYGRLTLYIAPARNEGFGLTPLEAMASSVAVVASDAGSHAQAVVSGETGMVVPAGDEGALAEAIQSYLADPERAARHGRAGHLRAHAHFSLEHEAVRLASIYRGLRRPAEDVFVEENPATKPCPMGE